MSRLCNASRGRGAVRRSSTACRRRPARTLRGRSPRREAGYSLVELMVSTAIMMVVTGAIFALVNPAQGTSRVQPEFADLQQRMRVGVDTLARDLLMAGAGPYQGATTGSLTQFFAPIVPRRLGRTNPDPPTMYRSDSISLVYVPNTASQTTIRDPMPNESAELKVNPQPNCPQGDPLCGFREGMSLMIFDPAGNWDAFVITNVQEQALHIQHRGQRFQTSYQPGAVVVEASWRNYYWDSTQLQLRYYDGIVTDVPVLDNVVGLRFTYFGDPNPPTSPRPPIGQSNCLFDSSGNPRLPVLSSTSGSLIQLDPAILVDGLPQWCGAGTNQFDPDLYRIRKVRVTLRTQAGDPSLRGSDPRFFARPGVGRGSVGGFVPDYELQFEVTPRNLNLVR
ncbi:MAG TPA: prepilin-type N-terminal cleavage/methylation domain-containing protein [Vicinamibacterales bacterium]|nr:prepilin-type N-terminal cleavage/methylation domain-containing protein [Vicinamibacterales bacterium]